MLGKFQESAEALIAAAHLNPAAPVIYDLLDRVYDAAPDSQPAIRAVFAAYVKTNHPGAAPFAAYGRMLFEAKTNETSAAAKAMLLKAIRMDPSCAQAYTELGAIAQSEGRGAEAMGWYEKAVRADARNAQAHYRLGLAYERAGLSEKAQQELATFRKLKSADPQQETREMLQRLR